MCLHALFTPVVLPSPIFHHLSIPQLLLLHPATVSNSWLQIKRKPQKAWSPRKKGVEGGKQHSDGLQRPTHIQNNACFGHLTWDTVALRAGLHCSGSAKTLQTLINKKRSRFTVSLWAPRRFKIWIYIMAWFFCLLRIYTQDSTTLWSSNVTIN